jgi:hypothetical protein
MSAEKLEFVKRYEGTCEVLDDGRYCISVVDPMNGTVLRGYGKTIQGALLHLKMQFGIEGKEPLNKIVDRLSKDLDGDFDHLSGAPYTQGHAINPD